jgi:hypothetical protein
MAFQNFTTTTTHWHALAGPALPHRGQGLVGEFPASRRVGATQLTVPMGGILSSRLGALSPVTEILNVSQSAPLTDFGLSDQF